MTNQAEPELGQDLLEYRSTLAFNREIFLLNCGAQFHAFRQIDENFTALTRPAETARDGEGRSYAGFLPPMLLLRRQANVAFDSLTSHQSYQAWVLLRPGLEASLMMGKWLDDPGTFEIWKQRLQEPGAYRDTYSGKNLRSKSLARSAELQSVLSRINDDFMHANPTYYRRHLDMVQGRGPDVTLRLQYFDDGPDHQAHLYAFLHLLLVLQDSLWRMWERVYGTMPPLPGAVTDFEKVFRGKAFKLKEEHEPTPNVLRDLGLWELTDSQISN